MTTRREAMFSLVGVLVSGWEMIRTLSRPRPVALPQLPTGLPDDSPVLRQSVMEIDAATVRNYPSGRRLLIGFASECWVEIRGNSVWRIDPRAMMPGRLYANIRLYSNADGVLQDGRLRAYWCVPISRPDPEPLSDVLASIPLRTSGWGWL